jgi:hypothetical protein
MINTTFKPLMDFNMKTDANAVFSRGTAVYTGLKDNPEFTTQSLPVDPTAFKSALDDLSVGIANAMDRGIKALAERDHCKRVVVKMLRQLVHYVEANCKDDVKIFLSSGFAIVSTVRQPIPPLSQFIRRIDPAQISGQLLVTLVSMAAAFSYELRWARAADASGTAGSWTVQPVVKTRPPVLITGLTPGATYVFQARALTDSGYTDWSDSLSRICI